MKDDCKLVNQEGLRSYRQQESTKTLSFWDKAKLFLLYLWQNFKLLGAGTFVELQRALRASGIDISHWQVYFLPSENPPYPNDFAVVKFSEGWAVMNDIEPLWTGAMQCLVRGAYHYYRSATSMQRQLAAFLEAAEGRQDDIHFVVLDFEPYGNELSAEMYHAAFDFLDALWELGYKDVLYTNKSTWEWMNSIGERHKKHTDGTHRDFWYAFYYSPVKSMQTTNPPLPAECEYWTIWQGEVGQSYGSEINGTEFEVGSRAVDCNVFYGTVEQLQEWAGVSAVTPDDNLKDRIMVELNSAAEHIDAAKELTSQL